MQLLFQKNFTIVRQISDHTDTNTYYVRAVIRNAFTDEIITTLDLDNKGSQRFKKDWIVPAQSSGEPYYVSIITSVYTDNLYTTKNTNYGDEEQTYQVVDNKESFRTGGGGSSLTRADVREIIQEELEKTKTSVNLSPVMDGIKNVGGKLKIIEKLVNKKPLDLTPLLKALGEIKQGVGDVKMSKADISSFIEKITKLSENGKVDKDDLKIFIEKIYKNFDKDLEKKSVKILKIIKLIISKPGEEKYEEEEPVDLKKLA